MTEMNSDLDNAIALYIEGPHGGIWKELLAGDMSHSRFLEALESADANDEEISFAEHVVQIESALTLSAMKTVDAAGLNLPKASAASSPSRERAIRWLEKRQPSKRLLADAARIPVIGLLIAVLCFVSKELGVSQAYWALLCGGTAFAAMSALLSPEGAFGKTGLFS